MPASHKIDHGARLIVTTWSDAATDDEFIDALSKYKREIKGSPEYASYNEILDLREVTEFHLSTAGLRMLGQIAATTDRTGVKTRLAIVVSSSVAFGLARMYEAYRSLLPGISKEVRVFKEYASALEWIEKGADSSDSGS